MIGYIGWLVDVGLCINVISKKDKLVRIVIYYVYIVVG